MYLAHLEKLNRTRLADVLVEEGLLQRDRVEEAQAEQEETGKQLSEILLAQEILTEYDLAKLITTRYSLPYLELAGYSVKREVVALLPMEFCEKHVLLPLDQFGSMLTIAVTEMPDQELIQSIVAQTKLTPCLFVSLRQGVLTALSEEKKRLSGRQPGRAAVKVTPVAPKAAIPVPPPGTKPDLPLPEFDLPIVSMKLVGVAAAKVPAAPLRISAVKDPPTSTKPGAALNWMDMATAAGPGPADASRAKTNKYNTPAAAGPPAGTPPANASPQKTGSVGGAWQSIFDVAEDSAKKPK